MPSKKPWATNVFTREFDGKRQRRVIENTPVDTEKLKNSPLSQEQVDQIYKKYGIQPYASKNDFEMYASKYARNAIVAELKADNKKFRSNKQKEKYIDTEVQIRLDKQWNFYKHRDDLIKTGQYDAIRTEQYRQQYLSHLRLANVDSDVIENIEKLTPEEWTRLTQYPDANPDTPSTRLLPHIKDVYSYGPTDSTDKYKILRDEIIEAFNEAGLKFKANNEREKQVNILKRKRFKGLAQAYLDGRLPIYQDPTSNYISIPLLGNNKGKNKQVVEDFLTYLDKITREWRH